MNYRRVIRHVESILNGCGDSIRFTPTGRKLLNQTASLMAVEVMKVDILRTNDYFTLPRPFPPYAHHRKGLYAVNIIHIPPRHGRSLFHRPPLFRLGAGNRYPNRRRPFLPLHPEIEYTL